MSDAILEIIGMTKCFGAVTASDGLTFSVKRGHIHALIGPNGAGKTTAVSQLSGELRSDAGRIRFDGSDITRWPTYRRARAGLQRSYQITSIFPNFTTLDNVALAIQAQRPHSFRFWSDVRREDSIRAPARAVLERVGLGDRQEVRVTDLAHGEQRQLEIAMVLATGPTMLLLDEPMAGMGQSESQRMMETLRPLKGEVTILLIEHDMDVVFALADVVTVLVKGQAIATGTPDEVRADLDVRRAYLGDY